MTLCEVLASARMSQSTLTADAPDSWLQGRTLYGGMSAALCLHAAQTLADGRPLRSASIGFVGPTSGQVNVAATLLRSGRTTSSIRASLNTEAGAGVEALFTFSANRESVLDQPGPPAPAKAPAASDQGDFMPEGAPVFTRNLEFLWVGGERPFSAGKNPVLRAWVRFRDEASRKHPLGLMAIADALPPAVAATTPGFAPLASMTWMIDFFHDAPSTDGGWWLLEACADFATGGHSSQDMTIWNTAGDCVAKGRQMVTVFA